MQGKKKKTLQDVEKAQRGFGFVGRRGGQKRNCCGEVPLCFKEKGKTGRKAGLLTVVQMKALVYRSTRNRFHVAL